MFNHGRNSALNRRGEKLQQWWDLRSFSDKEDQRSCIRKITWDAVVFGLLGGPDLVPNTKIHY